MPKQTMTHDIITAAIDGFEAQKKRIDAQIADLRQTLTGNGTRALATPEPVPGRRKMSAAARKRIADAQRKRWAAMRGRSGQPTTAEGAKPKRRISAIGREDYRGHQEELGGLPRAKDACQEGFSKR
jgi:hypothetical protein